MTQTQGTPGIVVTAIAWLAWATPVGPRTPTMILWPIGVSLLSAPIVIRSWLLRVDVDEAGLRVVNFFWSKRVEWEAVERFEIDQGEMSPSIHGFVVCRDGARVPITALQTRWMQSVERARHRGISARRIAELNRLLAARRGEPLPPLPLPRRLASPWVILPLPLAGLAVVIAACVWGVREPAAEVQATVLLAVGLAGMLAGIARAARVRVRADEAGVRLVGLLRSRRLAWDEVAGFEVVRRRPLGWRAVLHRVDGTWLRMPGLGSRFTGRRHLDRAAAELNAIHADQRPAHVSATATD